jgi:sulfide:quinone oxidoreductase
MRSQTRTLAMTKPQVLVLGGNFAGLGAAQKIRDHVGDAVDITVIDRKAYLDYLPNVPLEIFEGRNPAVTMHMDLVDALARDDITFRQAEVLRLDIDKRQMRVRPTERPGAPEYPIGYDYLVIALATPTV